MIYDSLENIAQYKNLGKNYAKAVEFLQRKDLRSFEEGKYEIDGKKVYATVSRYKTQDWEGTKWEAHRNYADIQVVLEGEEIIGYEPSKNMTTMIPYNPEKDVEFYNNDLKGIDMVVKSGYYMILRPQDGHKPKCMIDGKPGHVMKMIVKILEED